jgi:asparagine synthase (glutamine-hydrolysing)
MCGIAGFTGDGHDDTLFRMMDAIAHRGPDGSGHYIDRARRVFLGHRRLAIVDVECGEQPMWNEDNTVAVIFNGEIYNHLDLRRDLEAAGHRFRSAHSDTEVLVHGYEEWGTRLPSMLNGMFAFAIYDGKRIFIARDRFGEKPLYYYHRGANFVFASEINSLLIHPAVDDTISSLNLQKYFAYGFLPSPRTQYRDVYKLEPGMHGVFDLQSQRLTLERYWRFELNPDESLSDADEPRLVEELRGLLLQSVRRRLMSDVPLGIFLSGGVDSTAVVAAATPAVDAKSLSTFTIGFTEPSFDESRYAQEVAGHFGTQHHLEVLDMDSARGLIPEVLTRMDEPLGDASILPTYMLSRFTRRFVTVALSGDGGDELFAGYDPFAALAPASLYTRFMPATMHRLLRTLAQKLPASERNMSVDFKINRALLGLEYDEAVRTSAWMSPVDPRSLGDIFDNPKSTEEVYEESLTSWEGSKQQDPVDRTLEYFTRFYLSDDILTKSDRAAMFVSLESRAVFLDNDLVAFCERLPSRFKFRNGRRKYLLKKTLATMVPAQVLRRPKKGFGVPLTKWFRSGQFDFRPIAGLRMSGITSRLREHVAARSDHRLALWSWIALQEVMNRTRDIREEVHAAGRI